VLAAPGPPCLTAIVSPIEAAMRVLAHIIGFLLMATELVFLGMALLFPSFTSHRGLIQAEREYRKAPSEQRAAEVQRQHQLIRSENIRGVSFLAALFVVNSGLLVCTVRWIRGQERKYNDNSKTPIRRLTKPLHPTPR
jgi:hypothetical protein